MEPIIEMRDVSFSYGADAARALDGVSLALNPGEFLGVIGPSGAGKSTLASVLSGAIPHHYTGELFGATLVDGRDTCEVSLTDISRTVGSVLQDIDAQMVAAVVEDELLFGLENFGVPHGEIEGRLAEALDAVGIAELRDREIATLSGGQKQKVAIAAILALRPRVLVLDEPTAALDPASSTMVFDILRHAVRDLHMAVVVIEQKVALLSEYCDRVVVLDHGRMALEGTPREVFTRGAELRAIGVDTPRTVRIRNGLAAAGLCAADAPCLDVPETAALIQGVVGRGVRPGPAGAGAPVAGREAVGSSSPTAHLADALAVSNPDVPAPAAPGGTSPASPAAPGGDPARPAAPVLEIEGVSFAYPGGTASVDGLALTVAPGELVGVIGQNGAGKTTLTKLVNGLLKPDRGRVRVAGMDTREAPVSAIAARVATLFQNPDRQLCRDTVLDEVAFSLELHGAPAGRARERALSVIERFGLPPHEAPFSLSRGQRQMVALASVVVLDPALVILDEPTSGLDYRECMTVMETVAGMARRGCAVLMVCHDMEVVSDFAERLVVMARGRIAGEGPAGEVFADAALMERASVTPPQVTRLASVLATDCSPAFAGLTEVSAVVDTVKELSRAC